MTTPHYVLDNAWQEQRQRLAALEQVYDPGTIRHLEALGVARGWRCLEVGAGGGSMADWLCRTVGRAGHVVAIDIDTRFVEMLDYPQIEVRCQNLVTDDLEEEAFDLVHVRLVLTHLAGKDTVLQKILAKLVAALKPGGWLLAEELDAGGLVADPRSGERFSELVARDQAARVQLIKANGGDMFYGRRLYGDLSGQGLTAIGAEGRSAMARGGSAIGRMDRLSLEQVRESGSSPWSS